MVQSAASFSLLPSLGVPFHLPLGDTHSLRSGFDFLVQTGRFLFESFGDPETTLRHSKGFGSDHPCVVAAISR